MNRLAVAIILILALYTVEANNSTQVNKTDDATQAANLMTTTARHATVTTAVTTTTETIHINVTSTPASKYAPYIGVYDTCFTQKGCFGIRNGCVDDGTCATLATYAHSDGVFIFELLAYSKGYVAIALSDDEFMGNDGGVICYKDEEGIRVAKLWNVGGPGQEKGVQLLNETQGLTNIRAVNDDGWLLCGFSLPSKIEVGNWTFDLLNESYYLMVAAGDIGESGKVKYHGIRRAIMSKSVLLSKDVEVTPLEFPMVKYHAVFMILSWIGFASTGTLFSRYMKNSDWLRYRACGKPIWFVVHQNCMIAVSLFSAIALSLILAQLNGWTTVPIHINPHAALGCATMSMLLLQLLIASTRFKWKKSHWRFLCPTHRAVGHLTHILAVTTCFFGIKQGKAGLPKSIDLILSSYVVVHCVAHILLTAQQTIRGFRNRRSHELLHEDMSVQVAAIANEEEETCYSRLDVVKDEPNHGTIFHQVVVSTYLIVIWLLTFILVVVVSAPDDI